MGQIQSIGELISLLLRRKWLILAVFLVGTAAAAFYAKARPDTFESTAVIQIEMPTVSSTGVQGLTAPIGSGSAAVLQAIQQRLTTREAMLAMIERHGLFGGAPGMTDDIRVGLLRGAISFQPIASVNGSNFGSSPGLAALAITARLGNAEQAARVANDLAQSVLDETSLSQAQRTQETLIFFQEEETRLWNEILALESEVADFKNLNAAALPAQVSALQAQLVSIDTEIRSLDGRLLTASTQRDGILSSGSQRTTDQRQLADLNRTITEQEQLRASLGQDRARVETALAAVPEVERALSAFERRRQQLRDEHSVVTQRLAEAHTAQRLAERQQAERFVLLERAVIPEYPMGSGGRKLAAAGAMASLGLGIALAFLLDLVNPVVRNSAQLERMTGLRPVITLPAIPMRRPPARRDAPVRVAMDKTRAALSRLPNTGLSLIAGAILVAFVSALI